MRRNHPRTAALLLVAAAAALGVGALAHPSPAAAARTASATSPRYGWPVKPFFRQHPIRGAFGDPRILGSSHSFHFGVDVSCPNGTPVYAPVTGSVVRWSFRPELGFSKAFGKFAPAIDAAGNAPGKGAVEPDLAEVQFLGFFQTPFIG